MVANSWIYAYLSLSYSNENINGGPYTILVIISTIHLPLVLGFTIKHHKKTNKVNPIVPKTLQFHEDQVEDFENQSFDRTVQSSDTMSQSPTITNTVMSIVPKTLQFHEDQIEVFDEVIESTDIENESTDNSDPMEFTTKHQKKTNKSILLASKTLQFHDNKVEVFDGDVESLDTENESPDMMVQSSKDV